MFRPGISEFVFILLIVVVLFGAKRLPLIGDALGKGIRNFRQGLKSSSDPTGQDEDKKG